MQRVAKVWHLLPHDPAAMDRLAKSLGVSPVVAQLLLNRGLTEKEGALSFLEPKLNGLRAPEALPGATNAVDSHFKAEEDNPPKIV